MYERERERGREGARRRERDRERKKERTPVLYNVCGVNESVPVSFH